MLENLHYSDIFSDILPMSADTLMSMVGYRVLADTANCYAFDWWEGSYARILFPKANLRSQRISDFLRDLGNEQVQRHFFKKYLSATYDGKDKRSILIDSTGLPNDIQFPLTAINTHGGETNNETRLILVVDRANNMPLFFRYNPGNIVDVTTLKATIEELAEFGVRTELAIVDAGYYSDGNIKALYDGHISFLTRLTLNRKLYKQLLDSHLDDLLQAKYLLRYRGRLLYVKKVNVDLFGHDGYAYLAIDLSRRNEEVMKYVSTALEENTEPAEIDSQMRKKGVFILISSESLSTLEILPLYYTRQSVEQIFDVNKNNVDLIPLRTHSEETLRGHLMLAFLAAISYLSINNSLKGSDYNFVGAFAALRNLKCKVFSDRILVKEANKKANEITKLLKIEIPSQL
jgi:transposase